MGLLMRRVVKALRGEVKHGRDLFGGDVEPFGYVVDAGSGFKVFKNGRDR